MGAYPIYPARSRFAIPESVAPLVLSHHHADLDINGEFGWQSLYSDESPFTNVHMQGFDQCQFSSSYVLDRDTHHHVALHFPPTPAPRILSSHSCGYRRNKPSEFFTMIDPLSFTGQLTGLLGPTAVFEYGSLTYAKVSGQVCRSGNQGPYSSPWGGHATTFRESLNIGVLEGLERLACERPEDLSEVKEKINSNARHYAPSDFGVDPGGWGTCVPEEFSWVAGESLSTGDTVYLPAQLVYSCLPTPEKPWVQESSNGTALGGTALEAQLFGMLEVIERDSFIAAWYGRIPLSQIDVASVDDAKFEAMAARLKLAGERLVLLDATIGITVPTVIALAVSRSGQLCVGAGAHPDPVRAASSALSEVASDFQIAQLRYTARKERIEAMNADYSLVQFMEDHADLFTRPASAELVNFWLESDNKPKHLSEIGTHNHHSIESDMAFVLEQCVSAGFEPISVNCTTRILSAIGAQCWKTVIPGLIPIDFGQTQRVLHMPRLSKLASNYTEFTEPNPVPHPFP